MFLDSDDELLPGALAMMAERMSQARSDIDRLAFMYELAAGGRSPEPPLVEGIWDYEGYIRWSSRLTGPSDFHNCIRRRTFATLAFSDDRSHETLYHLEFAARFRTQTCPEVVARLHADAANRSSIFTVQSLLRAAPDNAHSDRVLLERHGATLRSISTMRYASQLKIAAIHSFLAGERLAGARYGLRFIGAHPSAAAVALLLLGIIGPRAVAWSMVSRSKWREGGSRWT